MCRAGRSETQVEPSKGDCNTTDLKNVSYREEIVSAIALGLNPAGPALALRPQAVVRKLPQPFASRASASARSGRPPASPGSLVKRASRLSRRTLASGAYCECRQPSFDASVLRPVESCSATDLQRPSRALAHFDPKAALKSPQIADFYSMNPGTSANVNR